MSNLIFTGRQSMLGDIIAYLPFLNWVEKQYPESFKIYSLAKKCANMIPFLVNHPTIDRIQVSEPPEGLGKSDLEIIKKCVTVFNPNPPLTEEGYYNERSLLEETFLMNQELGLDGNDN